MTPSELRFTVLENLRFSSMRCRCVMTIIASPFLSPGRLEGFEAVRTAEETSRERALTQMCSQPPRSHFRHWMKKVTDGEHSRTSLKIRENSEKLLDENGRFGGVKVPPPFLRFSTRETTSGEEVERWVRV